jgi:hypothetical protein
MSNKKLRLHNTETDNLISNLRGEVGEIIYAWVLVRNIMAETNGLKTSDPAVDMENPRLAVLNTMIDKLEDEIVARLSELAEQKVGRLNFHFVQIKMSKFEKEVEEYARFIKKNRFHEKRNYDISHKELPEKWTEHKFILIQYKTLVEGIVIALRLMKKIDAEFLGPSSKYLWGEMRKRRYKPLYPAKISYMLLPYLWPSNEVRIKIIQEEMKAGREVWKDMNVVINGVERTIKACGKWGAILLGDRFLVLPDSFIELTEITI